MNEFFENLLRTCSVSGCEAPAADCIEEYAGQWASSVTRDARGSVYVRENAREGGIMLDAHIDEIGVMVNYITDDGMLHVVKLGGIHVPMYFGHIVRVHTRSGILYGSVSIKRSLYTQDATTKDIIIDIGARNREEAAARVHVGDVITFDSDFRELLNGRICGRALDDKSGVYVILEALRRAKEKGLKIPVSACATCGEETTKDGTSWAAARVNPKVAIAVDVTFASDHTHSSPKEEYGDVRIGGGPVIAFNPMVSRSRIEVIEQIAREKGIPLQYECSSDMSYTNTDRIHFNNKGVECVIISIPMRYMHSEAELVDMQDIENLIELISAYLLYCNEHEEF